MTVTVKEARWHEDPKPDGVTRKLLVVMQLLNKGKKTVLFADKNDISLFAVSEKDRQGQSFPANGICIDQAFHWIGLPKGVELQTKTGWTTSVALDPQSYKGTYWISGSFWFFGAGEYKLTINPGGEMELPVLFVVPAKSQQFNLMVKGGTPVEVMITK